MPSHVHIPENILVSIWKERKFNKDIYAESGEKIEILESGDENKENGGPDFLNARVKIGNLTYVGDVEIDNTHADWKSHGHSINKRFNKVVLHAIVSNESNQNYVYTQDGRKINTICFAQFIDNSVIESIRKSIVLEDEKKTNKIHCYKVSGFADEQTKIDFLAGLGIERFRKKCEKMVTRLRELIFIDSLKLKEPVTHYSFPKEIYEDKLSADNLNDKYIWEQLFYESIFEALGYSQNRQIMIKMTHALPISFIESLELPANEFIDAVESMFFSVSGLIPNTAELKDENTIAYIRKMSEQWVKIKDNYKGETFESTDWHFFKLRPQNFPTLRMAAGARLVKKILREDLISSIMKKFYEIHNYTVLKNALRTLLIIKGDGYWKKHFMFDKSASEDTHYFLGNTRADEIFINVILPFVYVYFDLFNKKKFADKTLSIYSSVVTETENSLINEVGEALHIESSIKKSVIYQGMIELFRNYCSKERCEECPIGAKVFNNPKETN
jgi:hypothetical protein